jgi:hypothetical protein
VNFLHESAPHNVGLLELRSFHRHLTDNVLRGEDGLKVEPNSLDFQPHFQVLLDSHQCFFPIEDVIDHELGEGRTLHSLGLYDVIVKTSGNSFNVLSTQNVGVFALRWHAIKCKLVPVFLHLAHLTHILELLGRLVANFLKSRFEVILHIKSTQTPIL